MTNRPSHFLHKFCAGLLFSIFLFVSAIGTAETAFDLAAYRGKVVVLDFWASWCIPCRRSFPWMNQMQEKYTDNGLVIVAVNLDSNETDAQSFLAEYPARFRIINDPDGKLAKSYDVIAMPSSYIFDRDGNQVTRHLGFKVKQQDAYETLLVETLNK